jgi:hypothetical protein
MLLANKAGILWNLPVRPPIAHLLETAGVRAAATGNQRIDRNGPIPE